MYIRYSPSQDPEHTPDIAQSFNLYVLSIACLFAYAAKQTILVFELAGASSKTLVEVFSCRGRGDCPIVQVILLPQCLSAKTSVHVSSTQRSMHPTLQPAIYAPFQAGEFGLEMSNIVSHIHNVLQLRVQETIEFYKFTYHFLASISILELVPGLFSPCHSSVWNAGDYHLMSK